MTARVERSSIDAYAVMGAGQALRFFRYPSKDLGPLEVEIDIAHCGICHSDLHLIDNDWGVSIYPLVPGHEMVGTVARVGGEVGVSRKAQRVGVGWLAGACMSCEQCLAGRENLCRQTKPTCEVRVSAFILLDGQKSIGGSAVGANVEIREMLAFSAAHDIKPMIELFAIKDLNLALDRVRHNDMRCRAVLVNET